MQLLLELCYVIICSHSEQKSCSTSCICMMSLGLEKETLSESTQHRLPCFDVAFYHMGVEHPGGWHCRRRARKYCLYLYLDGKHTFRRPTHLHCAILAVCSYFPLGAYPDIGCCVYTLRLLCTAPSAKHGSSSSSSTHIL